MQFKKPVYNGYEEHYFTGNELKVHFKDCFYTTGRHHATILGLSVPDYLELLKVDDSKEYRVFINEYFCRVMDGKTDRLITFFGHSSFNGRQYIVDPSTIEIPKTCPLCDSSLRFKEGRYGAFLGCSCFPSCKYTVKIPIINNISI